MAKSSSKNENVIMQLLGNAWVERALDDYQLFRHEWSPRGSRWYHRRPTVSPIAPVLYWNLRESSTGMQHPFGSWGGTPTEVLNRLCEEIERFRPYWESLPDKRGIENVRRALSWPQRYFSFLHELATAFQLSARPGLQVDPLFLDPQSERGKPDIVVRTPQREFALQCKSEDPSEAKQLPYDLFQYFAGIFQRLVEDSGKSYFVLLLLKKNIDISEMNRIRNRIAKLIKGELVVPYAWRTTYADVELTEIGGELGAQSIEQIRRRVLGLAGDPLYHEFVPTESDSLLGNRPRGSVLLVFGRRGRELDQVITSAVSTAVKEAQTTLPLVVAVHLYQDINFDEFRNRPSVKERFLPWTDRFFKEHPKVAMIWLSSNHELYLTRMASDSQIGLKYARHGFVIESPEWDHKDVEELGI